MTVWSNVILCLFACCIRKMDVQQSTSYIKWYIAFAENNRCLFNNSAYTIEKPRRPLVWCVMWPGQGHSGHTRHQQMLHPVSGKKRAFTHFRQVITIIFFQVSLLLIPFPSSRASPTMLVVSTSTSLMIAGARTGAGEFPTRSWSW